MTTFRQARDKFIEMIDHLNTVKTALNAEARATRDGIKTSATALENAIAGIVPELNIDIIERLDRAAGTAHTERSFANTVIGLLKADDDLAKQIQPLEAAWSSPMKTIKLRDEKRYAAIATEAAQTRTAAASRDIQDRLKDIRAHNETYAGGLTPATAGNFEKLSIWRYATDYEFRSAYKALRDYRPAQGTFAADIAQLTQLNKEYADGAILLTSQKEEIESLDSSVSAMDRLREQASSLKARILGRNGVLKAVRAATFQLAVDNPKFAAALATEAGKDAGAPIALSALRIRTLQRSEQVVEGHLNGVEQTLEKLEKPLPKLKRAASNAGSSRAKGLDLDAIETGVNNQVAASRRIAGSAANFRSSVTVYQPLYHDDISFYMLQNMMLRDMIQSTNDAAYCHHAMGSTPANPGISVPDIGSIPGVDGSLQNNFNDMSAGFQTPDVSVPAADFSMPDISVPSVDFSVPSIDTSSFSSIDTSSSFNSSSYDSGSSYSSSSYDSGSSYSSSSFDSGSSYSP